MRRLFGFYGLLVMAGSVCTSLEPSYEVENTYFVVEQTATEIMLHHQLLAPEQALLDDYKGNDVFIAIIKAAFSAAIESDDQARQRAAYLFADDQYRAYMDYFDQGGDGEKKYQLQPPQ